jgi:hypothetical protein
MEFISGNSTVVLSPDLTVLARAEKLPPPPFVVVRPFPNFPQPSRAVIGTDFSKLNPAAIVLKPDLPGLRKFSPGLRPDVPVVRTDPPGLNPDAPGLRKFSSGLRKFLSGLRPDKSVASNFPPGLSKTPYFRRIYPFRPRFASFSNVAAVCDRRVFFGVHSAPVNFLHATQPGERKGGEIPWPKMKPFP